MTMLEKIARKLAEHDYGDRAKSEEAWEDDAEFRRWYIERAHISVDAMRDLPAFARRQNELQVWTAPDWTLQQLCDLAGAGIGGHTVTERIWGAVIDAILTEQRP